MQKKTINLRLTAVCMAAASVGLSMVLISVSKLVLLLAGLATVLSRTRPTHLKSGWIPNATAIAIMVSLAAFTVSLLWTAAPMAEALGSLAKYGKLIAILIVITLIRSRREALFAIAAFALSQIFLVLSSWMLFAHLPVPWATSNMAIKEYAVFSSYLDQGIISAVFAAVCWHLRGLVPGRFGQHVAIATSLLTMSNVLFVLSGRSGHAVAIALLSIAIMWELPRKYRAAVVIIPFGLVAILFFSSSKVRDRIELVQSEVQSYSSHEKSITSSGIRLGLWMSAIQLIEERSITGWGVGSWSTGYNRIHRAQDPAHIDTPPNGNPHQEYLQWGVQLGIPGILIFIGLLLAILRDALRMEQQASRAAISALTGLGVASLFNSSLFDALIGDYFCVTIGLMLALGAHPDRAAATAARHHGAEAGAAA